MFKCALCQDIGLQIVKIDGKEYAQNCFCDLKRVKTGKFGPYFDDKTLDNYEDRTPSMKQAREIILKDPFKSFFIYGNVGLGKTHLLAGIFEKLYKDFEYTQTIVTNEMEILKEIKDNYNFRLSGKKRIIIDDIGKVKISNWEITTFFDFYNDIFKRKMEIVISSNYSLEEIAEIYGGAIARRIEEKIIILHIRGDK